MNIRQFYSTWSERTVLALNWGYVAVNLTILLAPGWAEKYSCVKQHNNPGKDASKLLFLIVLILRLFATPLLNKAIKYCAPNWSKDKWSRTLLESEIVDATETVVFLFLLQQSFRISVGFPVAFLLFCIFPVASAAKAVLNKNNSTDNAIYMTETYQRGPYQQYKNYTQTLQKPKMLLSLNQTYQDYFDSEFGAKILSFLDASYSFFSLSSAVLTIINLLFNLFYDTTHDNQSPAQNVVLLIALFGCAIVSISSAFSDKAWRGLRSVESTLNTFYYFFMPSVSLYACVKPNSMRNSGFKDTGVIVTSVVAAISALLSLMAVKVGWASPYANTDKNLKEEHDLDQDPDSSTSDTVKGWILALTDCFTNAFSSCGDGCSALWQCLSSCWGGAGNCCDTTSNGCGSLLQSCWQSVRKQEPETRWILAPESDEEEQQHEGSMQHTQNKYH